MKCGDIMTAKATTYYSNQFPEGTIFEDTYGTYFRTISVWEIYNGFFAINAIELAQVGPNSYTDADPGYVEIYPAHVKRIVSRGAGILKKAKEFKYWELPVGTIFTVGGPNSRIGGTFTCDDPEPTNYVVYGIKVKSEIEVHADSVDVVDGVSVVYDYLVNCGKVTEENTFEFDEQQFNIVEVTNIVHRGDLGPSVKKQNIPEFKFGHPDKKKYYQIWAFDAVNSWLYRSLIEKYNLPHDVTVNIKEINKILKQSWVKHVYVSGVLDHYLIDRKRANKWIKQNINRVTINIRTEELIQTKNRHNVGSKSTI